MNDNYYISLQFVDLIVRLGERIGLTMQYF